MPPPEYTKTSNVEFTSVISFVGANASNEKPPVNEGETKGLATITAALSFLGSQGVKYEGINAPRMWGRPDPTPPPDDEELETTKISNKQDWGTDETIRTN